MCDMAYWMQLFCKLHIGQESVIASDGGGDGLKCIELANNRLNKCLQFHDEIHF